jgi:ubiquinone/menaquinone biosynthesis C-methylase UbiE
MEKTECPRWFGYFLINPFRRFLEDPKRMLGPLVREGMTVLEPGCGMGYFSLPLARMVGKQGKVVAVEIQPRMLAVLERRARRAHLLDRIELRLARGAGLGVEDFAGRVDFAAALHMVHEVPDQERFFSEVRDCLKPGGKLLFIEPRHRVPQEQFETSVALAEKIGFQRETTVRQIRGRVFLLRKTE